MCERMPRIAWAARLACAGGLGTRVAEKLRAWWMGAMLAVGSLRYPAYSCSFRPSAHESRADKVAYAQRRKFGRARTGEKICSRSKP